MVRFQWMWTDRVRRRGPSNVTIVARPATCVGIARNHPGRNSISVRCAPRSMRRTRTATSLNSSWRNSARRVFEGALVYDQDEAQERFERTLFNFTQLKYHGHCSYGQRRHVHGGKY